MDSARGRRPNGKGQTQQPVIDDYQPSFEWSQDVESHLLRVDLPDFRREELKVQLDSSGKLTVKGRRQVGEGRYMRLEQAFDVPKDTILDKISGNFEDGRLTLIMPKKVVEARGGTQKVVSSQEKKEEEPTRQKERPKSSEDVKHKEVEPTPQKEQPKSGEGETPQKEEEPTPQKEQPKSGEGEKHKEEEPTPQKEKPKSGEYEKRREEEPRPQKEQPKSTGEDEKHREEEPIKNGEEIKKEEAPIDQEKPKIAEKKEEDGNSQRERREKDEKKKKKKVESWYKSIGDVDGNKMEEARKKGQVRKKREYEDGEGWLDYGIVDNLLEKINRNRKVIAVAIVAFSIGFYVSHKLRSRGK